MSSVVASVTDATFSADVHASDLPVLVDVWATWCGPCRKVAPVVGELAAELAGKVNVVKADLDEIPQAAVTYGVMSVPTFLVFKGGELVHQFTGAKSKTAMLAELEPHL